MKTNSTMRSNISNNAYASRQTVINALVFISILILCFAGVVILQQYLFRQTRGDLVSVFNDAGSADPTVYDSAIEAMPTLLQNSGFVIQEEIAIEEFPKEWRVSRTGDIGEMVLIKGHFKSMPFELLIENMKSVPCLQLFLYTEYDDALTTLQTQRIDTFVKNMRHEWANYKVKVKIDSTTFYEEERVDETGGQSHRH